VSEQQKEKIAGAYLLVLSVTLAGTVTLLGFTARAVYDLNAQLAMVRERQNMHTEELREIQTRGSPAVQSIMVRLDNLAAGQARIEKALDEHMKEGQQKK
jgi:hypothetical protein